MLYFKSTFYFPEKQNYSIKLVLPYVENALSKTRVAEKKLLKRYSLPIETTQVIFLSKSISIFTPLNFVNTNLQTVLRVWLCGYCRFRSEPLLFAILNAKINCNKSFPIIVF